MAIPKHHDWTCKLAYASNASNAADLLLLPVAIGHKQSSAMVDSSASHNFISTTMLTMLKSSVPDAVTWRYSSKPLRVLLADRTVVLYIKIASLQLQFDDGCMHCIEFRAVPRLNHPLILGL